MIALIDCNNFYYSCERLFQPSLIGKPLIVLSNNDGCAISRSDEAKALGINMGTPAFMIDELIRRHNVQVRSSNYTLYGDMSERVISVIKSFAPKVEVYSIDEVFVDLSALKPTHIKDLAANMRSAIMQSTGIPVCIGVAHTKLLAKMANRYAKKKHQQTGIYTAGCARSIHEMQLFTHVENIWGIGREHAKFLRDNGFNTAADLALAPEEWMRKNLSVVGQRLLHELRGNSCIRWDAEPPRRKNICTSRSFGQVITDRRNLEQALASHTAASAMRMRKEGSCAKKIEVFIQTNPHRGSDKQYFGSVRLQLPVATNITRELIKQVMKGLAIIYKPGYNYQKAGVTLLDLCSETQIQMGLFDTIDRKKDKKVMESIDSVNSRFGKDFVRFGVHDYGREWQLKAERRSPCYTTRLEDIPKAKAN